MNLKDVMKQKNFAVLGDTLNKEKYAYIIKERLLSKGYNVYAVGSELKSVNDIEENIDIIDLCINPLKGLELLKECNKNFKCVVVQPGAGSEELFKYMNENKIPYIEGCLLVGLSLYAD